MKTVDFYKFLYRIIGDYTPLKGDCGKICGCACCKGDDETGMYLFPMEEKMYENSSFGRILDTDFYYKKDAFAWLFTCNLPCKRDLRPLACRIFPLMPYRKNGKLSIIVDPRAKAMCPLSFLNVSDFDPMFVKGVTKAMHLINKTKDGKLFIEALSRLVDENYLL